MKQNFRQERERKHERKQRTAPSTSRDLPKEKRRNFFASLSPKEKSSRNRLPDRVTVPTRTRTPPPRCSGRSSAACASPGSSFSCRHLSNPNFLPSHSFPFLHRHSLHSQRTGANSYSYIKIPCLPSNNTTSNRSRDKLARRSFSVRLAVRSSRRTTIYVCVALQK